MVSLVGEEKEMGWSFIGALSSLENGVFGLSSWKRRAGGWKEE